MATTTLIAPAGGLTRKGLVHMTTAAALVTAEHEAREFAAAFPTPNTLRAVALCESGRLAWTDVRDLFARSLGSALA